MSVDFAQAKEELNKTVRANRTALQLLDESEKAILDLKASNNALVKETDKLRAENADLRKLARGEAGSELIQLRTRYEALVKEKERMETQYQADYQKWREFKRWLLTGQGRRAPTVPPGMLTPQSVVKTLGKRKRPVSDPMAQSSSTTEADTSAIRASTSAPTTTKTSPATATATSSTSRKGRYATELDDDNTTINSRFRLNPAENGGVSHQFDEVVRNKHERKHLEGEDCECCHEYYERIGTLPEAPKAPAPRHAPLALSTRTRSHAIATDGPPPKTPPGYWDIGFPDTQEAANINRRAEEMHQKKRQEVELEARRGGKYVRR